MSEKENLTKLKQRYFNTWNASEYEKNGEINQNGLFHQIDCDIFRDIDFYGTAPCNCGLLYDLDHISESIKNKIYPEFWDDYQKQIKITSTKEEQLEARKLLEEIFGPREKPNSELEKEDWTLIENVFGLEFRKPQEIKYDSPPQTELSL